LNSAMRWARGLGFDIAPPDEALRRIAAAFHVKRFAVFPFDDASRDNLKYALPILRRQQCPFTLYVPTALVDGVGEIWWQALEDIITAQQAIAVEIAGETEIVPTETQAEKQEAYDALYLKMRTLPEPDRLRLIRD